MKAPEPFIMDAGGVEKRHAPATLRNRDVIADVLAMALPATGTILEIASGTGEHIAYFAQRFPMLTWQPSDFSEDALPSIAAWTAEAGVANVLAPIHLDAAASTWPLDRADAILCINMIHISPWAATEGLIAGAAKHLPAAAALCIYGPFVREGVETAPSNLAFDRSLKERNPAWGVRNLADVSAVAEVRGLKLHHVIEMPANNLTLIFHKG